MEEKDNINKIKEDQAPEQENVTEESKEEKAEELEKELDSSIEINKPNPDGKTYDEVVEEERQSIIAQNKKSSRLSTISIILVLGFSIAGIFLLGTIPVVSYILMGCAIVTLVVFSIVTHRIARPDIKGYIVKASTAINEFVFADTRFSEVKYDPNDKLELSDVFSDGVYDGLVRVASRNMVEGKFENRSFKVCECALFYPGQGKKQAPAFIGKYLTLTNDLHFEGRFVIVSKGEQDSDIPNALGDLSQIENDGKFFIYGPDTNVEKVLGKKFINTVKNIQVSGHLMNLTIVLWSGRTIVYASYDDATITLPFYDKYQADTAVAYRKDLVEILEALQLINKE